MTETVASIKLTERAATLTGYTIVSVPVTVEGRMAFFRIVSNNMQADLKRFNEIKESVAKHLLGVVIPGHPEGFPWGDCNDVAVDAKLFLRRTFGECSDRYIFRVGGGKESLSSMNILRTKGHVWHNINFVEFIDKNGDVESIAAIDFTANHNFSDNKGNFQALVVFGSNEEVLKVKLKELYGIGNWEISEI